MNLQDWVGREETAEDEISDRLLAGFNATFDLIATPDGVAPRGIHWCLAPRIALQSTLGQDGHPNRGDFLPPVDLPRRMWAGGSLIFHRDLAVGDKITRHARIASIVEKQGHSGKLCFVAVDHQIISPGGLAIEERQDIVYREAQSRNQDNDMPPGHNLEPAPKWSSQAAVNEVELFRYSALTFNGHRIHYDRDYAIQVEHYPGLVVHGPLQATWLLQFATECRQARPGVFKFRGLSPLIGDEKFSLNARPVDDGIELWVETQSGRRTMQALASF